jgi:hypothetical protein
MTTTTMEVCVQGGFISRGVAAMVTSSSPKYNLPGWYCSKCGIYRGRGGCNHTSESCFCQLRRLPNGKISCRAYEDEHSDCAVRFFDGSCDGEVRGGGYVFT